MVALDLDLLEEMYNRTIKEYSNNLASIPCTNPTQLDIIPRERSSKEIQTMFSWMQKEDKVFTVIYKNQIKLDFEGWELYNSTLEAEQESHMLHFLHVRRSC